MNAGWMPFSSAGHSVAADTTPAGMVVETSAGNIRVVPVAQGLEHPWSMVFIDSTRLLVSERPGRLQIVSTEDGSREQVHNVPAVYAEGQGGLLGLALDPSFEQNRFLYFSYAEGTEETNGTAVARARLVGDRLENVTVIFRQQPQMESTHHYGSRLVFDNDDNLFVTLGERFSASDQAQELNNHLGKLVRIRPDGSIPPDNPFTGHENAKAEIWSFGHRNIQGAALHPETGRLWIHEHGPRGGDEINIPEKGGNYGWPLVSFGRHYSYLPIPDRLENRDDLIYPIYQWTPSIAPSGMMFYTGEPFPAWRGDLFVGALAGQHLARLEISGTQIVEEEKLLEELQARIRDVAQGPDGFIYILTDAEDGGIFRLVPVR